MKKIGLTDPKTFNAVATIFENDFDKGSLRLSDVSELFGCSPSAMSRLRVSNDAALNKDIKKLAFLVTHSSYVTFVRLAAERHGIPFNLIEEEREKNREDARRKLFVNQNGNQTENQTGNQTENKTEPQKDEQTGCVALDSTEIVKVLQQIQITLEAINSSLSRISGGISVLGQTTQAISQKTQAHIDGVGLDCIAKMDEIKKVLQ